MICPKCEVSKMKCVETRCDVRTTFRRYRCPKCKTLLYTKEEEVPGFEVSIELSQIVLKRYKKSP